MPHFYFLNGVYYISLFIQEILLKKDTFMSRNWTWIPLFKGSHHLIQSALLFSLEEHYSKNFENMKHFRKLAHDRKIWKGLIRVICKVSEDEKSHWFTGCLGIVTRLMMYHFLNEILLIFVLRFSCFNGSLLTLNVGNLFDFVKASSCM